MTKTDALREALLQLQGPLFAVLDGAQFPNLPDTLLRSNLGHRCLYLDRGDNHPERLVTAPHMAGPLGNGDVDAVLGLLNEASPAAAVFWAGDMSGDVLFRHLRGINRIEVPVLTPAHVRTFVAEASENPAADGWLAPPAMSFPLFRHADANVVAQMKLGLTAANVARLLGPARRLICQASKDWDGFLELDNPGSDTVASRGRLSLSIEETLALQEARLLRFDARLASALRIERPDLLIVDAPDYPSQLRSARRRAVYLHGAESEGHIFDLVELEFVRGEGVVRDPSFRDIMDRRGWSMERRCSALRRRFLAPQNFDVA